jgi:hypothetical protein
MKKIPVFIGNVLYILSHDLQRKIQKDNFEYLTHPDEMVRFEAQDALDHLHRQKIFAWRLIAEHPYHFYKPFL